YYNPASDAARELVIAGVREILQNYPVDGIHFDDYFYPDGMAAAGEPFEHIPDGTDPVAYRQTQVDMLVSAVYGLCHRDGRVFGVSPVANIHRCTAVACADVARWMATAGYIDYVCPQLYVGFSHESLPFEQTLKDWLTLPRREGVALYGGLALYKAGLADDPHAGGGRTEWASTHDMLARQVTCLRQHGADGFVLFRYRHLTDTTPALTAEREALLALL
ncbi:MAG: family 10 glycosylhydrolase, partial [Clostridia bacterium]|nr:family 10 glycosylhydrolase [Clostridia bacterium]